jgi:molecular chaperone GrpE
MSAFSNVAGEGSADELEQAAEVEDQGSTAMEEAPAEATGMGIGAPESELERVSAERDEYLEALRRLQAEFDNYRKRMARQQTELLDRAAEQLLERLLPVLDAIDLALEHRAGASEGTSDDGAAFSQIAALLKDALAKDGLERIDAVGVDFDPAIHDAVAHHPVPELEAPEEEVAAGEAALGAREGGPRKAVVVEVLRAGYRLKGRVLRPAMVAVQG